MVWPLKVSELPCSRSTLSPLSPYLKEKQVAGCGAFQRTDAALLQVTLIKIITSKDEIARTVAFNAPLAALAVLDKNWEGPCRHGI